MALGLSLTRGMIMNSHFVSVFSVTKNTIVWATLVRYSKKHRKLVHMIRESRPCLIGIFRDFLRKKFSLVSRAGVLQLVGNEEQIVVFKKYLGMRFRKLSNESLHFFGKQKCHFYVSFSYFESRRKKTVLLLSVCSNVH